MAFPGGGGSRAGNFSEKNVAKYNVQSNIAAFDSSFLLTILMNFAYCRYPGAPSARIVVRVRNRAGRRTRQNMAPDGKRGFPEAFSLVYNPGGDSAFGPGRLRICRAKGRVIPDTLNN